MTKRAIRQTILKELGKIRNLRIGDSKTDATFEVPAFYPDTKQYKPLMDSLKCKNLSISFITDPLAGTIMENCRPRDFPKIKPRIEIHIEGIGLAQ